MLTHVHCTMAPITHIMHEICMAVRRENRSARKDDESAPKKEPKGIDATMAPCVEESGLLK